jgi:hypothetical protein
MDKRRRPLVQKTFLHSRSAVNTASSSFADAPLRRAEAASTGSLQRRKGLVAFSSAMLDGTVDAPLARSAATVSARCRNWRLSGSTANAKRKLASVYSCAQ